MKAVILAGGYGTRIRDVSQEVPKPMIPIGSHPVLWHVMKGYGHHNIKDFILCLGYKSESIKDYFLGYQRLQNDFTLNLSSQKIEYHTHDRGEDWNVTFAETGLNAYTGARVARIRKYVEKDDHFLLTYGDGVGDVDISALIAFHKTHGKLLTVTGAHPPGRFGHLHIDGDQVAGFNEKPDTADGWISAGYFVCSRKIFDYLPDQESLIFERDPIENIVKDKQMMIYKHQGFWHPMDTSRDYNFLNELWAADKAPWKVW